MTQNRQSRGNSRTTDHEWNEDSNYNTPGLTSRSNNSYDRNFDDNDQHAAQGSAPRWNHTSGYQGDNFSNGSQESGRGGSSYGNSNNYAGRNYGSGNADGRGWNDDQRRGSGYDNQSAYGSSSRGNQGRNLNEDVNNEDRGSAGATSRGMYGNDYGQGQYGSQLGRNYNQDQRSNRGYNESDNYRQDSYRREGNYGTGTGNNYDSGSNYGTGNFGAGNWGNYGTGNSGSGTSDRSFGGNRQGGQFGEHRGKGPKGYSRSDDRIKEDISDRLSDDDSIDASDIEVSLENGVVSLSGTVESREAKRRAEDLVESISGVSNVENRLRVGKNSSFSNSNNAANSNTASSATANNGSTSANANGDAKGKRSLANSHN